MNCQFSAGHDLFLVRLQENLLFKTNFKHDFAFEGDTIATV